MALGYLIALESPSSKDQVASFFDHKKLYRCSQQHKIYEDRL